jgi:hypothetical protein
MPSDEEGVNARQSGRSSPTDLLVAEAGEKGGGIGVEATREGWGRPTVDPSRWHRRRGRRQQLGGAMDHFSFFCILYQIK